jgi:hypothetical protein
MRKTHPNLPLLRGLSREPMVFWHCDIHGGNFMINDKSELFVIDFTQMSILPLSFVKYLTLTGGYDGLGVTLRPWVHFPDMGGQSCENASVLVELQGPMIQSCSFVKICNRVPGYTPPEEIF